MKMILVLVVFYVISWMGVDGCPSVCDCSQTVISCDGKMLTAVPSDIPDDATVIILGNNDLTSLPDEVFAAFSSLNLLSLHSNKIASISADAFEGLENVDWLILRDNLLTEIPPNMGTNMPSLADLYLNRNGITHITDDVFLGLSNLTYLFLRQNDIEELQASAFNGLSSLQDLDLSGNNLRRIDQNAFVGLGELIELTLSSNSLTELHNDVFRPLVKLESLHLDFNVLKTIPSFAEPYLPQLTFLNFNFNNISSLPDNAFRGLKQLETLNLGNNKIRVFGEEFFNADLNIKEIDLTANGIVSLPAFNSSTMPSFFGPRVSIDIKYNSIPYIGPRAFYGFKGEKLEEFNVDLSYSDIEGVDINAFEGISTGRYTVNLDGNDLTNLNPSVFDAFDIKSYSSVSPAVNSVSLSRNPWGCDCELQDLVKWVNENSTTYDVKTDNMQCASPDEYEYVPIRSIDSDSLCSPPTFDERSKRISTVEGGKVILDCVVTGIPKPSVYWITPEGELSVDTSIESSHYKVVAYNGLLITSPTLKHQGGYACVATNTQGTNVAVRYLDIETMEASEKAPSVVTEDDDSTDSISIGLLVGMFVAGLLAGLLVLAVVCICYKCVNSKRKEKERCESEEARAEMSSLRGGGNLDHA